MPSTILEGTSEWNSAALFLDADLSVLAWQPEELYNKYSYRIWKEYEYYGRYAYCEGRSAVLEKMLTSRDNLYFHPKIRERYESLARSNVKKEISILQTELAQISRKTV